MGGDDMVSIDYTNHRGERSVRAIYPFRIAYKPTPHHPEAQWILDAFDVEKDAERSFAMKDIHSWRPADDPPPASEENAE